MASGDTNAQGRLQKAESRDRQGRDIYERTFQFACRIVRLHRALSRRRGTHLIIVNQLVRAGTSVGSNLEEAKGAESRRDFLSKLRISLKEARESHYWLRIMAECDLVARRRIEPLVAEAGEIVAILTTITTKTIARSRLTIQDA